MRGHKGFGIVVILVVVAVLVVITGGLLYGVQKEGTQAEKGGGLLDAIDQAKGARDVIERQNEDIQSELDDDYARKER